MTQKPNLNKEIVDQLSSELTALPSSDAAANLAYAARVEGVLAENVSAPEALRALLHVLAAEAIAGPQAYSDGEQFRRLLGHLDAALQSPEVVANDSMADLIRQRKATAFVRSKVGLSPELLKAAIAAFEDVLEHPGSGSEADLGVFAFNAGVYEINLAQYGSAEPDRARVERFFRAARKHYKEAGQERRAADAAAHLAGLDLERLKDKETPASDLNALFADAWRLIDEAIAPISISTEPLDWAGRNELAAEILSKQPGSTADRSAREVLEYLDRALNVYQQLANANLSAECAMHCAETMSFMRGDWDSAHIRRFLYYVNIATLAPSADSVREAARCVLLANWCSQARLSGARESQEIIQQMRDLAEKAAQLAPQDDNTVTEALFLIGNSWMNSAGDASQILARASAAFEQARRRAQASGQSDEETKALRLLGTALGRRFLELKESDLLPDLLETLQTAAERSQGEERAVSYLNIASLCLEALQRGMSVPLEKPITAISKAREMTASLTPAHRDYLETLATSVDELVWGIREAVESAFKLFEPDGLHVLPNRVRPEAIYFKQYANERRTGDEGPLDVRTLLLFLDDDGRADGRVALVYGERCASASFELGCLECHERVKRTLPLITRFEEDVPARERLQQIKSGLLRCPNCNSASQIQYSLLATLAGSGHIVIIQPDALWQKSQYTGLSQELLLKVVYQAPFREASPGAYALRWSGIETFKDVGFAELIAARRMDAVRSLVRGILFRDEGEVRNVLKNSRAFGEEVQPLSKEEVGAALDGFDQSLKSSGLEPAALAELLNGLLEMARDKGAESVLEGVRQLWAQRTTAAEDFQAALSIASDSAQRRMFLERFLAETPDYSADREAEMYRLLQLGEELELRTLEAEGLPKTDPGRYAELLSAIESGRALAKQMMDEDRQRNTSTKAKALIADSLQGGKHFVLLLRAFRVDVRSDLATDIWAKTAGSVSDPRVRWQINSYDSESRSVLEKIASAVVSHAGVIMVANASDAMPPPTPAKLFVTNVEWRKLAFSLIAEAAAIILLLPPEELSHGVMDEIEAIRALARESQTALVLGKAPEVDLFETSKVSGADPTDSEELRRSLEALGLPNIFRHDVFLERAWEIVDSLMQSARPRSDTAAAH